VLVGVTVPLAVLLLGLVGSIVAIGSARRDRLPLFLLLNFLTLPVLRMLPTPAHDGVRLMLPTFFFLAGLAGLGFDWIRRRIGSFVQPVLAMAALAPTAAALAWSHPHELSYYNAAVGGLSGAMRRGFEVSYWYDAVTPEALDEMNRRLPERARLTLPGQTDVFAELQELGRLRGDFDLMGEGDGPTYALLLAHSAKSRPTTRLLYAMQPVLSPVTYQGVRLFGVYDARALARAQALAVLTASVAERPDPRRARMFPPALSRKVLELARTQPEAVVEAARGLADGTAFGGAPGEAAVQEFLSEVTSGRDPAMLRTECREISRLDPNAFLDAAHILIDRPELVAHLVRSECYVAVENDGGYLDGDAP
jgi:hypothetical protein